MTERDSDEKTSASTPIVFISYASQDAAVANAITEALERCSLRCWIAPRDVMPGAPYAGQIIHAIDAAKASVLILSKDVASSPHVLREVERSASKRHPIVSLRIDQVPLPADLEYFVMASHWLDASAGDMDRAMPKLVAAVQVAVNAPAAVSADAPTPATSPVSAPSTRKLALVLASGVGLGLLGLAVDRLWLSNRRAVAIPVAAPVVSAPVSVPAAPTILDKSVKSADSGAYQIAEVYAWWVDKDNAFQWLDRASVQHDGGLILVKVDPLLKSIRPDPRFKAFLRKMNLPE